MAYGQREQELKGKITSVFSIICLASLILMPPASATFVDFPSDLNVGPYIDDVTLRVIASQDDRVLALQDGSIQYFINSIDPVYLTTLESDPDINVAYSNRKGYGMLTINCAKYPLNISGFRRAFAYAYDKELVKDDYMEGLSRLHDSIVPYASPWCIEDEFYWHYYTARPDIGNAILDSLGFAIDPGSGFRLAPDGSTFDVVVEHGGFAPLGSPAPTAAEALQSLHVNASYEHSDLNDYVSRLNNHGDYDMVLHATNFYSNDVDWLAYDYWSEYADVPEQNPCNFRNASYDAWREQLLYGVTYDEVFEAAAEMQLILHENVPRLIVYQNTYIHAYRNDVFTGHIEDLSKSIACPWTLRKLHGIDGAPGGSIDIATGEIIDSFNFMITDTSYSRDATRTILDNLIPSLFALAPDLSPWPVLVEHMQTDTHSSNSAVPEGHIRFTLDIIRNATWSDGTPLTAEDVAFTFTYIAESGVYGNPLAISVLPDLAAAYTATPYRVLIEYNTESYWHLGHFAHTFILPKHIFNNETGIGYSHWNTWNPAFDPAEPFVTSGPFLFTDFESDSWYQISANPDFFYYPQAMNETTTTSTTTTSTSTNSNVVPWNLHPLSLLAGAVSGVSVLVIAYSAWNIWSHKRE